MARRRRREPVSPQLRTYRIHVVGAPRAGMRDLYHALLRVPWWAALSLIVGAYLALNAIFAGLYLLAGGITNAEQGSFLDAFFFSVQTMGTIGYGSMYPVSRMANVLVVAESVVGLVVTALATGLVFVRFSQTRARVAFSHHAAIGPMDGVPTLMIRVGNERANLIFDVHFRLGFIRTTRTAEGVTIYRTAELSLVRNHAATLSRSFTVLHRIEPGSPLYSDTPQSFVDTEVEFTISLSGTDDTSLQPVHARYDYESKDVVWGARLGDILSERPDGDMELDVSRFHELTATVATEAFPYPPEGPGAA